MLSPAHERLIRVDLGVRLADRYTLEERVASGGMAEVWRAWDEVLGRAVAVKLVSATGRRGTAFRRRFRDEARSAAGLTHPRVVTIHDYGETEDGFGTRTPYLVMEFLTGETLAERLTRGPLPPAEAVRVCGQVAEALAAAHRAGLVHWDVRPGNVFLTPDGVKVLDFGIARAVRGEPVFSDPFVWPGPLEPVEPLGPAPYLAPEQLGDHAAAPAADVYALGVVLGESLTGSRDAGAAMPPEVPPRVVELCRRCRAADPADRPSAAEVARTLAAVPPASPDEPTIPLDPEPAALPDPGGTEGPRVEAAEPAGARGAAGRVAASGGRGTTASHGQAAAGAARSRARVGGAVATAGLVLAVSALLIQVLVLVGEPPDHADGAARSAPAAGQPAEPAPRPAAEGPEAAARPGSSGDGTAEAAARAGAGADAGAGTRTDAGAADAGTPAKRDGDATAGSSAAPRPDATETMRALTLMASVVEQGAAAGEIRSDVAVDFNNLVTNLRNELSTGSAVEVGPRVADLRSKIHTRLREGALTHRYAEVLQDSLPDTAS